MTEQEFNLAILGKQSIDDDSNCTGQILSSIMGIPAATFCSKIEFLSDKKVKVTREVDFGLQTIELELPAVFTCDLRLNVPRFANVQNIIKAKKKPLETINLADMGIDF